MKSTKLLLQSIAGITFLLSVMAACLFAPAGSFCYSQGWRYLAAFFVPCIFITIYIFIVDKRLLQSRLSVGLTAERRLAQKFFQALAAPLFLGIFIISSFDYTNKWSATVPAWLQIAALAVVFLAMTMIFFVFKQNAFLSATVEIQKNQNVVSTGFYAIVRHPMYLFASIMLLFSPLALGSFLGMVLSVLSIVLIYFRAIDEEKELKQNLAGYEDYCKKVRCRIIPFVL